MPRTHFYRFSIMKNLIPFLLLLFITPFAQTGDSTAVAGKTAAWITLEGDVDPGMNDYARRAIAEAVQQKPDYIIFEINTFGGRLDAAFDIVDTIMGVKGPKTVTLVRNKAISAGALISLASKELYMLHGTTIGDCAPIVQNSDGTPQIVGEKIQSPLRAKFRNLAQKNHYPELLSAAMVTPELEVLELKHKDSVLVIDGKKYAKWTEADKAFWGSPKILVPEGELLTMTDEEALAFKFSKATLESPQALEKILGITRTIKVEISTGEKIARFIGTISGILLIVGFGALYLEFKTPGMGMFGVIGIAAIALVFFGQFAGQLDNYFPAILLVIGALLFIVEILILPGTFLFGIGGIGFMIAALALIFKDSSLPSFVPVLFSDTAPWIRGLFYIMSCAVTALLLPIVFSRYIVQLLPEGWTPMLSTDLAEAKSPTEEISSISIGMEGVATTPLRPVGHARINGILLDVQTHGDIIESGTPVRVIAVSDGRIWVSPTAEKT